MKKILNLVTILLFLNLNAQEKHDKNIIITDNISVHQKYTTKSNEIKWELFVKNKKYNKILKIDQLYFNPTLTNILLIKPNVINGFIENNFLYLFIYRAYNVDLIKYDINDDKITSTDIITIAKLSRGSGDNFGLYKIKIIKYHINNKPYFFMKYGRGSGRLKKLFKYDVILDKAFELKLSEDIVEIPDENEIFKTLDLDTNKEKIITELKRALLLNRNIKKNDIIEYLGYGDDIEAHNTNKIYKIRDSGNTFFYFKKNNSIKIAKYSNDEFEWHLGTYTEEEIKEKIPKID